MNVAKIAYGDKLKNKLFGLLKEREKDGEWEKFLETIEMELIGMEHELQSIYYYSLRAKISSLKYLRYKYFRTVIFDCMTLIGEMWNE